MVTVREFQAEVTEAIAGLDEVGDIAGAVMMREIESCWHTGIIEPSNLMVALRSAQTRVARERVRLANDRASKRARSDSSS